MIDLYTWPTPNGYKPLIFLEEAGLEYKLHSINIGNDEQFAPDFLKISPNNKIPALVDGDLSLFESGAMLMYLARKTKQFIPPEGSADYYNVLQWLMWQVGGLGPMMGQAGHFRNFAPEDVPYGKKRYLDETHRLFGVLNRQLEGNKFIASDYSIADMMIYPWIYAGSGNYLGIDLSKYPNVSRWLDNITKRPAVKKAYEIGPKLKEAA